MRKFEQMKRLYSGMIKKYPVLKYDDVTLSAVTSDFDQLFELCWKTLKEYLCENLGIHAAKTGSPKLILQLAYREGLVDSEEIWLKILNDRNDDTHKYNVVVAIEYASNIMRKYLPVVRELIDMLSELIAEELGVDGVQLEFAELFRKSGMLFEEYLDMVYKISGYDSVGALLENWDDVKPVCEAIVKSRRC